MTGWADPGADPVADERSARELIRSKYLADWSCRGCGTSLAECLHYLDTDQSACCLPCSREYGCHEG